MRLSYNLKYFLEEQLDWLEKIHVSKKHNIVNEVQSTQTFFLFFSMTVTSKHKQTINTIKDQSTALNTVPKETRSCIKKYI